MEKLINKKALRTWIFFLVLGLLGLAVGALIWGLTKDYTFFSCFALSYPFSILIYLLWGTSASLLNSENRGKIKGVVGIIGRFFLAIIQIAVCFVLIYFTTKSYYYILIPPTIDLFVSLFVIWTTLLDQTKKEG